MIFLLVFAFVFAAEYFYTLMCLINQNPKIVRENVGKMYTLRKLNNFCDVSSVIVRSSTGIINVAQQTTLLVIHQDLFFLFFLRKVS